MLARWALGLAASLLYKASQAAETWSLAALASVKGAPSIFHAVMGAADFLPLARAVQKELPVIQFLVSSLCKQRGYGCLDLQPVQLWCVLQAAVDWFSMGSVDEPKIEATLLQTPPAIQNHW